MQNGFEFIQMKWIFPTLVSHPISIRSGQFSLSSCLTAKATFKQNI